MGKINSLCDGVEDIFKHTHYKRWAKKNYVLSISLSNIDNINNNIISNEFIMII